MTDAKSIPFTVGSHGDYEWLVTTACVNYFLLDDFLQLCPEIVLGKWVAITSIDSGGYFPNDEEKAEGWERHGDIAYSPRVSNTDSLPRDGWDEWYVFEAPFRLAQLAAQERNVFVEPHSEDEVCDFVNLNMNLHSDDTTIANLFWGQLDKIRPQTYIAESDPYLTIVCADKKLFAAVQNAVARLEKYSG
jgi:hypothetical protein